MASKKRRKKRAAPKRKKRARAPAPKRRAARRSMSKPKLIVVRGERIFGKGFVWHGRYGSQHMGSVVAPSKGKATKQLRAHAARAIRGGR
jgi:hypothetical protein